MKNRLQFILFINKFSSLWFKISSKEFNVFQVNEIALFWRLHHIYREKSILYDIVAVGS